MGSVICGAHGLRRQVILRSPWVRVLAGAGYVIAVAATDVSAATAPRRGVVEAPSPRTVGAHRAIAVRHHRARLAVLIRLGRRRESNCRHPRQRSSRCQHRCHETRPDHHVFVSRHRPYGRPVGRNPIAGHRLRLWEPMFTPECLRVVAPTCHRDCLPCAYGTSPYAAAMDAR